MPTGDSHRRDVRAAAERAGLTVDDRGGVPGSTWLLLDADGREVWRINWLRSGYFANAQGGGVFYGPDYRHHAYTSTPRQALDNFLAAI